MSEMRTTTIDPLRKAALLVAGLDAAAGDALLDRMPEEFAAKVRRSVMELRHVDPDEQRAVLEEFYRASRIHTVSDSAGVELDESLARRLAEEEATAATYSPPSRETMPFQFLHHADLKRLAPHLEREHPQTVAVVISHLHPERAAELLELLSPAMQTSVVRRLVDLDAADPEGVRQIEIHLEELLHEHVRTDQRRAAGRAAVDEILRAARNTGRRILVDEPTVGEPGEGSPVQAAAANRHAITVKPVSRQVSSPNRRPQEDRMAAHVNELKRIQAERPAGARNGSMEAESILPFTSISAADPTPPRQVRPAFEFEDLVLLEARSLSKVLTAAGPQLSLLALAGATPEMVSQILSPLEPREATALRRRMENLGALRLSDLAEAQREVARIAAELIATNKISMPLRPLALSA